MFRNRTKGLLQLHLLSVAFVLPAFFIVYTCLYSTCISSFDYAAINYALYFWGVFFSQILAFLYDAGQPLDLPHLRWYQTLRMTNRQILGLIIILFSLVFITKDKAISRIFIASFISFSWGLCWVMNHFLPKVLAKSIFDISSTRFCILVGDEKICQDLEDWLLSHENLGLTIVGYVSQNIPSMDAAFPYLGSIADLSQIIKKHKANQIILLETHGSKDWVFQVIQAGEKNACKVWIYSPWREYFNKPIIAVQEGVHTFFTFREDPLENPANRILKRILDILVSLPIVIVLLPILIGVVKIFQLLESPGPLFFKQTRIGLNNKPFTIYKFRSMFFEKQALQGIQASAFDKRIFRFGHIMRKTSIDEFPQFINVLLGHMSVVGPRPHFIGHDKLFNTYIYQYRQRHFVKPGVTGLAQIKGYRGEITDLALLRERTNYDLAYIDNWSISLDIVIICKTIWQVLFPPKTAY